MGLGLKKFEELNLESIYIYMHAHVCMYICHVMYIYLHTRRV